MLLGKLNILGRLRDFLPPRGRSSSREVGAKRTNSQRKSFEQASILARVPLRIGPLASIPPPAYEKYGNSIATTKSRRGTPSPLTKNERQGAHVRVVTVRPRGLRLRSTNRENGSSPSGMYTLSYFLSRSKRIQLGRPCTHTRPTVGTPAHGRPIRGARDPGRNGRARGREIEFKSSPARFAIRVGWFFL